MTQGGLEPPTYCLEGSRSIQLSYWVVVPGEGIEPSWDCSHRFLRPECIPFHHPGMSYILPQKLPQARNIENLRVKTYFLTEY